MARQTTPPEQRFWRHVKKERECWVWVGAIRAKGYGAFQVGKGVGAVTAHRYSWVLANGPIPDGLIVMHQCDNRLCVNPKHLMLGTSWANSRDMVSKGRSAKGAGHSQAVLTEALVIELRRRYGAGEKLNDLAAEFGISRFTAHSAIYINWKHLEPFKRTRKVSARGPR